MIYITASAGQDPSVKQSWYSNLQKREQCDTIYWLHSWKNVYRYITDASR